MIIRSFCLWHIYSIYAHITRFYLYLFLWSDILFSSISLISLRRVLHSVWNKWHRRNQRDVVVSGSKLHALRGLRKSRKLCLNLSSFKWDRPIRSLISNCNSTGLWIPNISQCNGWAKHNKEFLNMLYGVILIIFISSLFHSFIYNNRKKGVHKILRPAVKRRDIF